MNQWQIHGYNLANAKRMKRFFTVIALSILITAPCLADDEPKRQTVYSLVKQRQTTEWYKEQAGLWGKYLEENQTDGEAWLNYYTANRMLKIYNQGVTHEDLIELVDKMEQAIPESFEFHYVKYWNGGNGTDPKLIEHLQKAFELEPNRPELNDDFMTYYELKRDKDNLEKVAKRWLASNDISPNLYAWNYNMLQSTEEDAILFTVGDNDTYPAIVLQHAKGIRTDVAVINTSLIAIKDYRDLWLKELGMAPMNKDYNDYKSWAEFEAAIINHFKTNTSRPIYFAISAHPRLYQGFKDEVHNVGMALKWSPEKFDNIAVIKRNYEKKFLTDHLKVEFQNDISQGVADHANANYLISMLTLYNHYEESEDTKAEEIRLLIQRIAEKNNMEDQVEQVINKKSIALDSDIDPRILTKNMIKINDTMYASSSEVSNKDYMYFMATLLKHKDFETLNKVKNPGVDWISMLSDDQQKLDENDLFANGHPDSPDMPVVNVSKEAAETYCEWLTESYNGSTHKKKAHNKVIFRLPTEKEWEYLAKSGKEQSAYAWGGPYVRNAKGCFLANLDVSDVDKKPASNENDLFCDSNNPTDQDGGLFPVSVKSYIPNDFGLYNMTGNVSEMVKEPGIAKGGSWNTKAGIATIENKETIFGPSPELGFRVIMIVKD